MTSCSTRAECHLEPCFIAPRPLLRAPLLHALPEELGELVDLVRRKERRHLAPDGVLDLLAPEEVVGQLVEVAVQEELPAPPGARLVRARDALDRGRAVLGQRVVPFRMIA